VVAGPRGTFPARRCSARAGDAAIAGHQDTYFRPLRHIQAKDLIVERTLAGSCRHVVQYASVANPGGVAVLGSTRGREFTLVTCYPFYWVGSAPQRFIVRARGAG
jgi:sortase A